jgi:branched-chain amino acid transport system ATP-binding protein
MDTESPTVIEIDGLTCGYEGVPVVRNLSLHVAQGEVVGLLGPNGAGKTTTLLAISGTIRPLAGSVTVLGARPSVRSQYRLPRKGLAHVTESRNLFYDLTVSENLRLGVRGSRARRAEGVASAYDLFPQLRELADRRTATLSGGEQQMLAVARSLASNPRVLLLDEMSLGLAPVIVEKLLTAVRDVASRAGCAIVLVEQHVELALEIVDRAYVLAHGSVTFEGSAETLRQHRELLESSYLGQVASDAPRPTYPPHRGRGPSPGERITVPSPELDRALAAQRDYKQKLAGATDLEEVRRLDATEIPRWSGPLPDGVSLQDVDANGVPAQWVIPAGSDAKRAFMYLHGGGFVLGTPDTVRTPVARAVQAAGIRGFLPRYRLAPEHLYPANVEDVVTAYRWLLTEGVAAEGIVIGGESAGGGLVVASLLAIRDARLPMPAGAVPISPMVDFEFRGESWTTNAELDGFVSKALAIQNVPVFLGPDQSPESASPINADLTGLPPLLVQVGGSECILDDARAFTDKARAAGVDAELEVWPEMVHLWHNFSYLPQARQALDRIAEFITTATKAG